MLNPELSHEPSTKPGPRIAIIGGGSAYAPGLIQAFTQAGEAFEGAELVLMDVAERELEIVDRLAQRLVASTGLSVSSTADRRTAISGADIVLTTFREGGLAARHLDESVPLQFGVIGQETIGPGGFFFAQRTLPTMRQVASEIEELAPNATLVNYSNPTQIVAEAMVRYTAVRTVAICDQTDDDRVHIAGALGISPNTIELESAGVNHATWSSVCTIAGEDGVAAMDDAYADVMGRRDVSVRTKRIFELTRHYRQVPNGYLPYYYFESESVAEAVAASATRSEVIAAGLPEIYQHFAEQAEAPVTRLSKGRGGSVFGDFAVRVIKALLTGERARLTLNVTNDGSAVPYVDRERIVEVPCLVEAGRITPKPQPDLANDRRGLIRALADYQAAAADAIRSSDPIAEARALASNPLVRSLSLADRLLAARWRS